MKTKFHNSGKVVSGNCGGEGEKMKMMEIEINGKSMGFSAGLGNCQ